MDTPSDISLVWQDVQQALAIVEQGGLPQDQHGVHSHLELDGRCTIRDGCAWLPAIALSSWTMLQPDCVRQDGTKVLLKLPLSMYYSTAQHSRFLRIFRCSLISEGDERILDACVSTAVVISAPKLREDECVQVIELFAGGFCGWGQSVHILSGLNCPVRVRSLLDVSPECAKAARFVQGGLIEVRDPKSLAAAQCQSEQAIFAVADIGDDWWFQLLDGKQAHMWCASPPCQPWSSAAAGPGLNHPDGRLILRLASLLKAFQPLGLCLEQVTGFQRHEHYETVQSCFQDAGFVKIWEDVVELGDFLPASRPRYLEVWLRADVAAPTPACPIDYAKLSPSLQGSKCVITLPPALLRPCQLSSPVMDLYMDPKLLPLPVRKRQQEPMSFRLRKGNQRFSCIMVSYHFQHELPMGLLESSQLLGALYDSPQGPRFLSGAEAAMCHAACRPQFLPEDDRMQMRIQGNCLSVPQAALCVVRGLFHLLPPGSRPSPTQALQACLQHRVHSDNFVILPCGEGWVLCKEGQCQEAGSLMTNTHWGQLALPSMAWKLYVLHDDESQVTICIVPGVQVATVLAALGVEVLPLALQQAEPVWSHPGSRPNGSKVLTECTLCLQRPT